MAEALHGFAAHPYAVLLIVLIVAGSWLFDGEG